MRTSRGNVVGISFDFRNIEFFVEIGLCSKIWVYGWGLIFVWYGLFSVEFVVLWIVDGVCVGRWESGKGGGLVCKERKDVCVISFGGRG